MTAPFACGRTSAHIDYIEVRGHGERPTVSQSAIDRGYRLSRVAPTSRLAGPLRSQDRPWIGRGDPSADGLRVFVGRIH